MVPCRSEPPGTCIEPLGVLAHDHDIDRLALGEPKRGEVRASQPHRAEVHEEVEAEAKTQEDVPRMRPIRDARVADRSNQNRREVVSEPGERVLSQGLARGEVVIGTVRKRLELDGDPAGGLGRLQNPTCLSDDLGPNAIAR